MTTTLSHIGISRTRILLISLFRVSSPLWRNAYFPFFSWVNDIMVFTEKRQTICIIQASYLSNSSCEKNPEYLHGFGYMFFFLYFLKAFLKYVPFINIDRQETTGRNYFFSAWTFTYFVSELKMTEYLWKKIQTFISSWNMLDLCNLTFQFTFLS